MPETTPTIAGVIDQYANERWLPVVGYEENYQVSNMGRLWSNLRIQIRRNGTKAPLGGKFIGCKSSSTGYIIASLRQEGREGWHGGVHRLVLATFVGPCPSKYHEGCHNNGIRDDNRLENLRWDSIAGNQRDTILHGTKPQVLIEFCPRGHEYTEENTYWQVAKRADGTGDRYKRSCLTCRRDNARESARRKAAEKRVGKE